MAVKSFIGLAPEDRKWRKSNTPGRFGKQLERMIKKFHKIVTKIKGCLMLASAFDRIDFVAIILYDVILQKSKMNEKVRMKKMNE
jgi:hypothetical protein